MNGTGTSVFGKKRRMHDVDTFVLESIDNSGWDEMAE